MSAEPEPEPEPERLGWEAHPSRALIALAGPTTLSLLSFACMGVVDTWLVGGLGAASLAGVGLGLVITNFLGGFGFGLLRGVKILLAQTRSGGGREEHGRAIVGAGVLVALQLGALMLVLGELAALLAPRFCASVAAGEAARSYIAVRALGLPILLVYVALREARYGYGETRSPLISALIGNVLHAGLDYVVLYRLGWGAAGAALANLCAFTLQASLLAYAQKEGGFDFGPRARRAQRDVVRTGAFTGLQFVLEIGSVAALSLLLAGTSDLQMAAHQIAVQLEAFCFLPAMAIAESATVLAAEAYGRARASAVFAISRASRRLALGYAFCCAAVLVLAGRHIAAAFTRELALAAIVPAVLVAVAAHQVFDSIALSCHGILRGIGAARYSALCALACAWLCTPWLGWALARSLQLGAVGVWIARTLEMAVVSFILWRYIERGAWQRRPAVLLHEQPA